MIYENQLILTGKINDVGAYTRENVDYSERKGIELEAGVKINQKWSWSPMLLLAKTPLLIIPNTLIIGTLGGKKVTTTTIQL